jgi:hypothetical protein
MFQFFSDLDETKMELSSKVIRQPTVIVVDAEVGGADFAHPKLLLLVRAGAKVVKHLFFVTDDEAK